MKRVLNFLGFDIFGTGTKGGSGVDADDPILGAHAGTPIAGELTSLTYGYPWTLPSEANFGYNNAGVTGLERHKIGVGAERRNTFVFQAGRGNNTNLKTTFWTAGIPDRGNPGVVGAKYGIRFGFNLTDFTEYPNPAAPIAMPASNVDVFFGSSSTPLVTRAVAGSRSYWAISGISPNLCPDIIKGQPTHFEVEIGWENPGTGNAVVDVKLYVNGDLLYAAKPWSVSQTTIAQSRLRFTIQATATQAATYTNSFGLSDLMISSCVDADGNWTAPLGPQVILPAALETVTASGWDTFGGVPMIQALTDGNDATYVTSALDKTPMTANYNLRLPVGAEVNGVMMYGRVRRDVPASAPMQLSTSLTRMSDGAIVANDPNRAVTGVMNYQRIVNLVPNTVAGAAALEFADSGKLAVQLKVS